MQLNELYKNYSEIYNTIQSYCHEDCEICKLYKQDQYQYLSNKYNEINKKLFKIYFDLEEERIKLKERIKNQDNSEIQKQLNQFIQQESLKFNNNQAREMLNITQTNLASLFLENYREQLPKALQDLLSKYEITKHVKPLGQKEYILMKYKEYLEEKQKEQNK